VIFSFSLLEVLLFLIREGGVCYASWLDWLWLLFGNGFLEAGMQCDPCELVHSSAAYTTQDCKHRVYLILTIHIVCFICFLQWL
jgi:hypothetical protein